MFSIQLYIQNLNVQYSGLHTIWIGICGLFGFRMVSISQLKMFGPFENQISSVIGTWYPSLFRCPM